MYTRGNGGVLMQLAALEIGMLKVLTDAETDYTSPMTSKELGNRLNVNPAYIRERANGLLKAGLIQVRRGPGGGYFIIKPFQEGHTLRVTIDGVEYGQMSNLVDQELWTEIRETIERQKRIIQQVRVNGQQLDENTNIPYQEVELIQVDTIHPNILLKETYDSAAEYLPRLIEALQHISGHFRSGADGEAVKLFLEAEPGLKWNSQLLQNSTVLLKDEETVHKVHGKNEAVLVDLLDAWENEDFVTVADLMEYELIPNLRDWLQFIETYKVEEK